MKVKFFRKGNHRGILPFRSGIWYRKCMVDPDAVYGENESVQYAIGDVYIGDESYGEVAMVWP